jgi:hypothetical protein
MFFIKTHNFMKFLPIEIVDIIADYHDYDKYCKPQHKENFKNVLKDILLISKCLIGRKRLIVCNVLRIIKNYKKRKLLPGHHHYPEFNGPYWFELWS